MIHKELLSDPLAFKKLVVITVPLVFAMQRLLFGVDQVVYMMKDVIY